MADLKVVTVIQAKLPMAIVYLLLLILQGWLVAGAPSIEQALDQYITEHRVEAIAQVYLTFFLLITILIIIIHTNQILL